MRRFIPGPQAGTSLPNILMVPEEGRRWVAMSLSRVVFPAPLCPNNATNSPWPISSDTALSAGTYPYCRETALVSTAGAAFSDGMITAQQCGNFHYNCQGYY